jgi:hypothetical protein
LLIVLGDLTTTVCRLPRRADPTIGTTRTRRILHLDPTRRRITGQSTTLNGGFDGAVECITVGLTPAVQVFASGRWAHVDNIDTTGHERFAQVQGKSAARSVSVDSDYDRADAGQMLR